MTTLVAINTRDAIIMGSDSLGTVTKTMIDPADLAPFFDTDNGLKLKLGSNGIPLLDDWSQIMRRSQSLPANSYTHVEKIFPLSPLEMGIMCSGVGSLSERSLKSLIWEFRSGQSVQDILKTNYSLFNVGELLLQFIWPHYEKAFPELKSRPDLELMLCGYDKDKFTPGMVRIHIQDYKVFVPDYDFCIFFGGITREIQRLVFGTDMSNKMRLIDRSRDMLNRYHDLLVRELESSGARIPLKSPEEFKDELELFHNWNLEGLVANWGAFSEQTAIECVDFLINVIIHSQEFSSQIPSVGGKVQIALVKKQSGFQYISRREWNHGGSAIPVVD